MSTIAAHRSLTHAAADFWGDLITRLESWFQQTPTITAGLVPTPEEDEARKIADKRFWREMRMLESCQ